MNIIEVKNLRKYFGKVKAVDDISFEVKKGEIVGFLGPNGAGKTTTIRCMMDFIRPLGGTIEILGKEVRSDASILMRDIGFLPSETNLYEEWTGKEHIEFVKKVRKTDGIAKKMVKQLDFDITKKIEDLSTGNKQKLELILALMHKPKVLILDEPTTGLDPLLQDVILDVLKEEADKGTTIFMSSHNLGEVERVCDRVIILKEGKVITTESIPGLKKKRLYTVYIYFDKRVSRKKLKIPNVKVEEDFGDGVMLNVKGDIRPVLRKINTLPIKDLEIAHSNLEKIFLEYYR